jgi:hypothetical protein
MSDTRLVSMKVGATIEVADQRCGTMAMTTQVARAIRAVRAAVR